MKPVTTAQALETYKRTVRDCDRSEYPVWVIAVGNSLVCGEWIGSDNLPDYAKEVYEIMKAEKKISMADSK